MMGLRDLLVRADFLVGVRGGPWTLVEVAPLPRGDLRLRFVHDEAGPVESMAYGVFGPPWHFGPPRHEGEGDVGRLLLHVVDLPAPVDARARVAEVLARSKAVPRGGWVDLAGPLLDALVPEVAPGSLAAWCATVVRFDPVRVEGAGQLATLTFAMPTLARTWTRFGELLVRAELEIVDRTAEPAGDDPDREASMWCTGAGEVTRTEGTLRLGSLGPLADRLEVPPDAPELLAAWHDIVRARLERLLATPETMIVPWLVAPDAPLANLLEMRAARGPVPPLTSARAPTWDAVAQAAALLGRLGDTAWGLGEWSIEVDLPAGELRITRDARTARVLVRHPWDAARYGALDEDAAGAVLLARWLRAVLLTAGQDATVTWHPVDPDVPDHRGPLVSMTVTQWLAMEPPDVEVEPVLDWRVQGWVVGTEPWCAWEPPGAGSPDAGDGASIDAQKSIRDAFVRAWRRD